MSKVEIIVLNAEDARTAEAYGADRLELVSAMTEGGLTPSHGIMKTVVRSVKIPVMVMVRPHSFSFVYRKEEWEAIREDIKIIKELGAAGMVFGAINDQQKVDFDMLSMVLEEAKGLSVTFHRAIDETNSLEAYHSLCQSPFKVDRILTSGGRPTVSEGLDSVKKMINVSQTSKDNPIIMPGSGLSVNNIEYIHNQLHAAEYHFGSAVRKDADFHNQINGDEIQKIKKILS
ncbi:copper homeostasis protein CutC [Neobacillus sp. MM2021_6]|uniref:copper homeostasis protein CutC n=1 Tax=Bacillaceae TaxID=186817 RepID=UPI00140742AA|nr:MULTISPECIES: copper homeostasis protein CutC [Bacillaceae]MBO0959734.1 copper homeostasis protein CutC [Neobacillus sp. MM2021_6]NHC19186.1 copper homeostasis protein CutC [Bacillus sp. MM2020_4]